MSIGHYLMFDKNCAEALACYEEALGLVVLEKQTYGDLPPGPDSFPVAGDEKGLILHARARISDDEIMCADTTSGPVAGSNMYVSITTPDEDMVRKAFEILSEGGKIYMPLSESFFAKAHGSLQDRFGINWMFTAMKE